jgi:preprotein translocase SecF subunit
MHWLTSSLGFDRVKIDFLGKRWIAFVLSVFLLIGSFVVEFSKGLNLGIDFTGGILIEARFENKPDMTQLRQGLQEKFPLDISLQTIGEQEDLLIRVGQAEGDAKDRVKLIQDIKAHLEAGNPQGVTYRKIDYVGPKVGKELIMSGVLAMTLAVLAILLYIWFRFEWQYGVGAIVALVHDAVLTVGFFSLTQIEFNLASVAAILTIIGYSINDSVVIFDRIRENARKYKKKPIEEILNTSINDNLSRTLLTSLTTIIALGVLVAFGGEVIKSFSLAALFGVVIGTYSSIYVAAPILIYMKLRPLNESST